MLVRCDFPPYWKMRLIVASFRPVSVGAVKVEEKGIDSSGPMTLPVRFSGAVHRQVGLASMIVIGSGPVLRSVMTAWWIDFGSMTPKSIPPGSTVSGPALIAASPTPGEDRGRACSCRSQPARMIVRQQTSWIQPTNGFSCVAPVVPYCRTEGWRPQELVGAPPPSRDGRSSVIRAIWCLGRWFVARIAEMAVH